MWTFFGTSQKGDYIIHVMRRMDLSRVQLNVKKKNWQMLLLIPYLPRNNYSICPQRYVIRTFILRHFSKCWNFIIMWCVEEYCNLHK